MARARRPSSTVEGRGLAFSSTDFSETQPPLNNHPEDVGTDASAPARCLRAKRKPKLTNEGRAPNEDRKRTKKHSTFPASRKVSGKSASNTGCIYQYLTIKPIDISAASMQEFSLDPRKLYTSFLPAHLTQSAPAATSPKLAFPPPHLQLPTATKTISQSPLRSARKSSYERRHGGPQFTIYEDNTATHRLFSFGSDYPFFPWDFARSTTRSVTGNTESNQENDPERSQEIQVLGSIDGYVAGLAVMPIADVTVAQRRPIEAKPLVLKQTLEFLRLMR
jgi:hypothetical protein